MNKNIKVIELFNMIANGNIPEMIEYNCQRYQWYFDEYRRLEDDCRLTDLWKTEQILNDEVEILEDEEEIDIQAINENDYRIEYHSKDIFTTENLNDLFYKVAFEIMRNRNEQNEILKAVKQLDKKINKED